MAKELNLNTMRRKAAHKRTLCPKHGQKASGAQAGGTAHEVGQQGVATAPQRVRLLDRH